MNGITYPAHTGNPSPVTSSATVFAAMDCAGDIFAFPTTPLTTYAKASGIFSLGNFFIDQVKQSQTCRASQRGGSLTTEAFKTRYGGLPDMVLYPFTTPVGSLSYGPVMSDWSLNASSTRLNMPSTCTFDHTVSSGECAATFSGLSGLFGVDMRINAAAGHCPSSHIPELYLECEGAGCHLFNGGFKACTANSDCSNGLTCRTAQSIVEAWGFTGNIDVIGKMLFGNDPHQCSGNSKFYEDFSYFAARALGQQVTSPSQAPSSFCFYDTTHIRNTVESWPNAQSATSGNVITVTNLGPWTKGTAPPNSGVGATFVVSTVMLAIGVLAAILF